ncbi:MAG: phosphatidylglycerophosphatase A [Candidatus Krumholzibacteriota bacterium]|nr:phosphatidylglycerophosphatase A [Candidatus Krumholzibacteriota bacterium]
MPAATKFIATFAYTGFFPFAPATFASAVFCGIYYFVPGGEWLVHPVVVAVTVVISVPVSGWMEKDYGEDPSCVVIDEVVGMQVILMMATGVGLVGLAAAFFLFRFFDILKPFPVGRSQNLPGGWGIVVDDFLAGIYTRIVLILLALAWPSLGDFLL